ncbi:hypothetical protein Bca101_065960 [Brassica carinata]
MSLWTCKTCVVMDDELNILPLSPHIRSITQVTTMEKDPEGLSEAKRDITSLKDSLNVRGRKRGTKTAITVAFLLLGFCGLSACAPLLTIHSPDGDIIECINTLDQPSLKSPLLKNHVFQDYPSGMMKAEEGGFGWQVWHRNGTACPHGSFPIRRVEAEAELSEGKYGPLIPDAADRATRGHQERYVEDLPIYGTKATLNVWNPVVESGDDFSLAQIWVTSGSYENEDLNTLETGWQVYPNKYGDHQPRLFTYWTSDAYLSSGCYNHYGKGFVHVNRHVALGGAIAGTSTIGGDQFDITLQIWKRSLSLAAGYAFDFDWNPNIWTTSFREHDEVMLSFVLDSIPATTDNLSSPSVTSFPPTCYFTFSLSSLDHMDDNYKQNFCGRGGLILFRGCCLLLQAALSVAVTSGFRTSTEFSHSKTLVKLLGIYNRECFKDPLSGHWWLGMGLNVVPIGYWPVELFTTLSDHASEVQWGGEVIYLNSSGMRNTTQMGSGEFPGKGFRKAAYFFNLQIAEKNRSFLPPRDFQIGATQPNYYSVRKTHSRGCGDHFYYGGPGPLRSSSFQSDPLALMFLFFAVYFVV